MARIALRVYFFCAYLNTKGHGRKKDSYRLSQDERCADGKPRSRRRFTRVSCGVEACQEPAQSCRMMLVSNKGGRRNSTRFAWRLVLSVSKFGRTTSRKSAGGSCRTCVKVFIGPRPMTFPASMLVA